MFQRTKADKAFDKEMYDVARDEYKAELKKAFTNQDRPTCAYASYNLGLSLYKKGISEYNNNAGIDEVIKGMQAGMGYANYAGTFHPAGSRGQKKCFKLGEEIEETISSISMEYR